MALENDVQDLTAAIRELTTVLSTMSSNPPQVAAEPAAKSKPAAKKEKVAEPEAEELEVDLLGGEEAPEAGEVTPEDFMQESLLPAFKKLLTAPGGQAKAKGILTKAKAPNLAGLPKTLEVYQSVLAQVEEALNG